MKKAAGALLLVSGIAIPAALWAQAAAAPPTYSVLAIYRETVKPGKSHAHDALENAWAAALASSKPMASLPSSP